MNTSIENESFSFSSGKNLYSLLLENSVCGRRGYWIVQFESKAVTPWIIGVIDSSFFWSGTSQISSSELLKIIFKYISKQEEKILKAAISVSMLDLEIVANIIIIATDIIGIEKIVAALKISILSDLDRYLVTRSSGQLTFISQQDIKPQIPLKEFSIFVILAEFVVRSKTWAKIRSNIPSLGFVPLLNHLELEESRYSYSQKTKIKSLFAFDGNLFTIASEMRVDLLVICSLFAKMAKVGLVSFEASEFLVEEKKLVMMIDDSIVMLSRFDILVRALGHSLITCQDPEQAIKIIKAFKPSIIFIDLNMPNIGGFELVKMIRKETDFKPKIVILTGERSTINEQRAIWSGCSIIYKPIDPLSVISFKTDIRLILSRPYPN